MSKTINLSITVPTFQRKAIAKRERKGRIYETKRALSRKLHNGLTRLATKFDA